MKKLGTLLIILFGLNCLYNICTSPTIADGVFLVACVGFMAVKVDLLLPADSK